MIILNQLLIMVRLMLPMPSVQVIIHYASFILHLMQPFI